MWKLSYLDFELKTNHERLVNLIKAAKDFRDFDPTECQALCDLIHKMYKKDIPKHVVPVNLEVEEL